ncbi:MAG: DUF4197 domain-containing protein [Gammaproteobacteria bacterium]|nr:DUF4197 domain-containing protein [Gammaproteobacteria bacterium]
MPHKHKNPVCWHESKLLPVQVIIVIKISKISVLLMVSCIYLYACNASLNEFVRATDTMTSSGRGTAAPSSSDMATAIRQALSKGVENSINTLGKTDGFNANQLVRIALPDELQKADTLLRKIGQGRYADQFVLTMNRAAEQAIPKAASIFGNAIRQMSIQDALDIIKGPDDAATRYFQRTSETKLINSFRPAVEQATNSTGVTQQYKSLVSKAGALGQYISEDAKDIDGYITGKATDALFLYIAQEEKKIRDNPVERTTEILSKVFGYYLGG